MAMRKAASTEALQLYRVMEEFLRLDENLPVAAALIFLSAAKSSGSSPTIGDIAKDTGLTESRASRNIIALEEQDLLRRDRDPDNFRQKIVSLTERGQSFCAKITGYIAAS